MKGRLGWIRRRWLAWHGRRAQQRALRTAARHSSCRIVVGSAGIAQDGWIATDREVLDLLDERTWLRCLEPGTVDAILAEHVWEHLPAVEGARAAATCYRFLRRGGYVRVAVPDGLHPSAEYRDAVRPGGRGAGADEHRELYNWNTLSALFRDAGFEIRLLEFFDASGAFHQHAWDPAGGLIRRSARFDPRNAGGRLAYTSIILDAMKP